jgi:ribonuclease HI
MLYDDGKIGEVEFQIYMRWYSEFTKQIKVAQTLYIRADPDVCMERIRTRGRPGEEGISAAYLETCHKYHDDMIWGIAGAHTVNANGMASQEDYRLWFGAVTANAPKPPKSAAVTLWFDGGSRGNGTNRTVAGSGALLETHPANGAEHLANCTCHLGNATNNEAEYVGLIIGLQCAVEELGATTVHVRGDSKLVIEQMSGNWAVKAPNLTPLHAAACRLAAGFKEVTYTHVPRNQNKRADKLSNDAMDDTSAARSVDSFYAVGKPQRVSDL